MNYEATLKELEELAGKLGVDVSYDTLMGEQLRAGGLCKLKGRWRVIIEKRNAPNEKVVTLAQALARFNAEDHYLSPSVRSLLERYAPANEVHTKAA